MGTHLPDSPDEEVINSQMLGDATDSLAPEIDSVSGGVIQEPAWPAPNRDEDFSEDQRIVNRVHNLRTMATTNSAIAGHLKALGLAERTD